MIEGTRIIWSHKYRTSNRALYKPGEFQRFRVHKKDHHGPQMAVIILDEAFCEKYVPVSELTLEAK